MLMTVDQVDGVVADYQAGHKLRKICEKWDVTQSQAYYALKVRGVTPNRVKIASRLDDGDPQTLVRLYAVMEAQDRRIQQLEAMVVLVCDAVGYEDFVSALTDDTELITLLHAIRQ